MVPPRGVDAPRDLRVGHERGLFVAYVTRERACPCGAGTWATRSSSNLTRRVDFALFMVEALENDGEV
jgi:hypothetical protein